MDGRCRWLAPLLLQLSSSTQILPDCSLEAYDSVWHSPFVLSGCPSLGSPVSVAFTLHTRAAGLGGLAQIFEFVSDDGGSSLSAYVGEDGRFSFEAREDNTSTVTTIFQVVGATRRFLLTLNAQGSMTVRMDEHSVLVHVQRSGPAQQALTALPRRIMIGGNAQGGERLDGRLEDFWVFAGLVGWHSAALPGELTCWGNPDMVDATPNGTFVDVNVGYQYTCAVTTARTLVCWGPAEYVVEATPPSDLGPVVKFRGGTKHSCALIEGGSLRCWGRYTDFTTVPSGHEPWQDVELGMSMVCGLAASGKWVCWGWNHLNQTAMPPDLGHVSLTCGASHCVYLREDGSTGFWGTNNPIPNDLGSIAEVISGLAANTCVSRADASIRCWGDAEITFPGTYKTVAAGVSGGLCRTFFDGSIACEGYDRSGRVSLQPTIMDPVIQTSIAREHICVRTRPTRTSTTVTSSTVSSTTSSSTTATWSTSTESSTTSATSSSTTSSLSSSTTSSLSSSTTSSLSSSTTSSLSSSTTSSLSSSTTSSLSSSTTSSLSSSTTSSLSSSTTSSLSSSLTSSLSSSTTSSLSSSLTLSLSSSTMSSLSSSTTSSLSSSTTSSLSSSTWSSVASSTTSTLSSSSTNTGSSTSAESSSSTETRSATVTWTSSSISGTGSMTMAETITTMVTTTTIGSSTRESYTSMLTTEGSAATEATTAATSMMAETSTSPPSRTTSSDMWSTAMIEASTAAAMSTMTTWMAETRKAQSTEMSTAMGTVSSTASTWADTSITPSSDGSTAVATGTRSSFAGDTSTAAVTWTTSSAGREARMERGSTTAAESSMSTEVFSPATAADSALSSTRSAPSSTRSAPPLVWDGTGSVSSSEEASRTSSAATRGPGALSSIAGTSRMSTSPGRPAVTTLRAEVASRDAGMQAWQSTALTTQWEGAAVMQMAGKTTTMEVEEAAITEAASTVTVTVTVPEAASPASPASPAAPETAELEATAEVRQSTEKLLQQLRVSNETVQTTVSPKGAVVSVVRLVPSSKPTEAGASDAVVEDVELTVETGRSSKPITVVIPGKLMRNLTTSSDDEPVLVVSPVTVLGDNFSNALASGLDGTPYGTPPLGAVQIDLRFLVSGEEIPVTGLEEPLLFTMPPVIYKLGMVCRFYDEELLAWSEEGTGAAEDNVPGEVLKCWTRHLSLFAAFLQGFLDVLKCGQFQLLNMEALRRLWREDWYWRPGARIFFAVLTFLSLSFLVSAALDHRRQQSCLWCDEWFLLDVPGPGLTDEDLELMSSECSQDNALTPTQHRSLILSVVGAVCALFGMLGRQIRHSSAVRDALDEIGASWLESFSEVRSFLEGLLQGLEMSASTGTRRLFAVSHGATCAMVLRTSRRLVGAELRLSDELVAFVLDDAGVRERLCELHRRGGRVSTSSGGSWQACKLPEEMWMGLHHEVCEGMRQQIGVASSWRQLPCSMLKLFLAHSPLGLMWSLNLFRSCKLRAFFFALELVGALLLCALFFQASGGLSAVDEDPACEEVEDPEAAYLLGRLVAISLVSVLVAGLPVSFLHSLQTRHFKRMDQAYRARQLRVWRLQDGLVWVLGSLYLVFGLTFFALFLANIGEEDQEELAQQGGLALLQDCVFLPLALAFMGPMLAGALLHATAWAGGMGPRQLLQDVHVSLNRRSNAMLPVMQV